MVFQCFSYLFPTATANGVARIGSGVSPPLRRVPAGPSAGSGEVAGAGSRRRFRKVPVQDQVQVATASSRRFRRRSGRLECRARSRGSEKGSAEGSGRSWCGQIYEAASGFLRDSGIVSAQRLGMFRPCSDKFWTNSYAKINYCCCWGYHRSLFLLNRVFHFFLIYMVS